jgi:trans-aconitate 2-methyltransferase
LKPLEWDAATYDRVADPQEEWAREVIARADLRGDETLLDAGCGSGRVTRLLVEALPRGRVIAVDGSEQMVALARQNLGGAARVECQDLVELALPEPVDVVFSTAVFHHIQDHPLLFAHLFAALTPGGRLIAQCGGAGNVERFRARTDEVAAREPYADHLNEMGSPWNFASPAVTEQRLLAAGFDGAHCWLEPKPAAPADAEGFARTVLLNYHVARLPAELVAPFVSDVLERVGEPLEVDYVRLNIDAQR